MLFILPESLTALISQESFDYKKIMHFKNLIAIYIYILYCVNHHDFHVTFLLNCLICCLFWNNMLFSKIMIEILLSTSKCLQLKCNNDRSYICFIKNIND